MDFVREFTIRRQESALIWSNLALFTVKLVDSYNMK